MRTFHQKLKSLASGSPAGTRMTLGLLAFSSFLLASEITAWRGAQPGYVWEFPRDHWAKNDFRNEWWYFTGHLSPEDNPARTFGYQFTFFRVGLTPNLPAFDSSWSSKDLIMGHAALTDPVSRKHIFSEVLYRVAPMFGGFGSFPESLLAWSRGPIGSRSTWKLFRIGEEFHIEMEDPKQGFSFNLQLRSRKQLVFQGPNGFSRKSSQPDAASHYYSFTRLETEGELGLDGQKFSVRGTSWMDREFFSNLLTDNQVGWDWFSLQLDDNSEIMLYQLRDKTGVDWAQGTLIPQEGKPRYLSRDEFQIQVLELWQSESSGVTYPAKWRLNLLAEGLDLEIVPRLHEQENLSQLVSDLIYWEGAVDVNRIDLEGRKHNFGSGFVELTGYGEGSRPPLGGRPSHTLQSRR